MSEIETDRVDRIMAQWNRERPDIDVSPQAVIGRLHRLGSLLQESIDAVFAEFDLSSGDFDVLATLRRSGEPFENTAGELAAATMISSGGLTKRVDRLEQRGLVTRSPGTDSRVRRIALTPSGRDIVDAALDAHMVNERRLMAPIHDDADQLAGLLRRWLLVFDTAIDAPRPRMAP